MAEERAGGTVEAFDAPPASPKRNPPKSGLPDLGEYELASRKHPRCVGRASRGRGVRHSSLVAGRPVAPRSCAAATIRCGKTPFLIEFGP